MKIAVIGGGISGLACAHRLLELSPDLDVQLFEAGNHLGGSIASVKQDGFLLEKGPDSFISEKPWALQLCKRLGMESAIIGTQNKYRQSFIARQGKLIPVPEGFYLIAPTKLSPFLMSPLFSLAGKLRMASEMLIPRGEAASDESVASFIRRRFGKEALERAGQPMIAGIYTGDPEKLSIRATMPRFCDLEQTYGSLTRGLLSEMQRKRSVTQASGPRYSLFLSFQDGMKTLVDKLSEILLSERIHLNSAVTKLDYLPKEKKWRIQFSNNSFCDADFICISISAAQTANLLQASSPPLAEKLRQIAYESAVTINFGLRRAQVRHPLDGFGFVVPITEKKSIIACSFSSVKFAGRAPEHYVLLRTFSGGAFGREFFNRNDSDLIKTVLSDLSHYLGISGEPELVSLARHPQAMVQYQVGHGGLVEKIEDDLQNLPGIFLGGSAYHGVGIPDCIHEAEIQAEKIIQKVRESKYVKVEGRK